MTDLKFRIVGILLMLAMVDVYLYNRVIVWLLNQPEDLAVALGMVLLFAMTWISYKITTKVIEKW